MDAATFLTQVRAGRLDGRVYLFAGRESFLKERALEQVKSRFVPPDEQAESFHIIDFAHREASEFPALLHSFSFSSGRRVFALYQFDKLGAAERKQIYAVLKQAIPEDALVFLLTDETPVAAEAAKALAEVVQRLDFWPPFENQVPTWVRQEAADAGAQMTPEAV
ncbi:MAG TPA: hypothetical protein PKO06_02345, partial [Candidatus Ozemobacteraceae bacterium]|nr:hypothetical protein [Candidatus Ozemobacteraceae bacterium]